MSVIIALHRNLHFDLVEVLGSRANGEDLERLLYVIDRTNFSSLPDDWSRRAKGRSLAPGIRGRGGDFLIQSLYNERALTSGEA